MLLYKLMRPLSIDSCLDNLECQYIHQNMSNQEHKKIPTQSLSGTILVQSYQLTRHKTISDHPHRPSSPTTTWFATQCWTYPRAIFSAVLPGSHSLSLLLFPKAFETHKTPVIYTTLHFLNRKGYSIMLNHTNHN